MAAERHAEVSWSGSLMEGSGRIESTGSGAIQPAWLMPANPTGTPFSDGWLASASRAESASSVSSEIFFSLTFMLNAQQIYDVGFRQNFVDVV